MPTLNDFITNLPDAAIVRLYESLREESLIPDPSDQSSVRKSEVIDQCNLIVSKEWSRRRAMVHRQWNEWMFGKN